MSTITITMPTPIVKTATAAEEASVIEPESVPLYERHGFKVLGTIQVGTSPPIFPMLRKPGGRGR